MSELFSFGNSNQESMGDFLTIQVKILNRAVKNLKLNFIRDAQILKQNRKGICKGKTGITVNRYN